MTEERPEGGRFSPPAFIAIRPSAIMAITEATMAPGAHPTIGRPHFGSAEPLPAAANTAALLRL